MRMRGVYVFDSTCTVLAVYKVVQMDPEDRRRARLSRRKQLVLLLYWKKFVEAAIQVSILFFFLTSFISNTQTMESSPLSLDKQHNHLLLSHFVVYTYTWCMYINQQKSWSTLSPLHSGIALARPQCSALS